jgi:hypothetical protein
MSTWKGNGAVMNSMGTREPTADIPPLDTGTSTLPANYRRERELRLCGTPDYLLRALL